jgi:hypothetical protein
MNARLRTSRNSEESVRAQIRSDDSQSTKSRAIAKFDRGKSAISSFDFLDANFSPEKIVDDFSTLMSFFS